MRIDKKYPYQLYADFWDWLNQHPIWMINVVLGSLVYLLSTDPI